jgi:hypothetical protein
MKPLSASMTETFYQRFDRAINGELQTLTILSPTTMILRLSVQDEARAFDWIDLELEISGVSDARIIEEKQLSFLDMSEGISILFEEDEVIVCVGDYVGFEAAINAPLFIRGSALKYQENTFSA